LQQEKEVDFSGANGAPVLYDHCPTVFFLEASFMRTWTNLMFLAAESLIYVATWVYAHMSDHHRDMCVFYLLLAATLGAHSAATLFFYLRNRNGKRPVDEVEE
jgi:hypothetical protein